MQDVAIFGAGGFGKETSFLLETINRNRPQFDFKGFVDDNTDIPCQRANPETVEALVIAIAWPVIKRKIHNSLHREYDYPNLIAPDVLISPSVTLGKGLIICSGVKITVDVKLADFVIINLNVTIGHDTIIGPYSSIMPSANISGNVTIGAGVFVGSGAVVLQGRKVGDGAVIGAGAVVTKDVPAGVVVKGVPGRWT